MPSETLAGRLGHHVMGTVVYSQMEGVGTGTALLVLVGIGICTARRILCAMPSETLAGRLGYHVVGAMVDRQVERNN